MNTNPTPEEIGRMCAQYIEKHGYDKFSAEFYHAISTRDNKLWVYVADLGEIAHPFNRFIADCHDEAEERLGKKRFNKAITKLQLA